MGELPAARPYYEKALEIRKKVLGEEHPDTARSLNNLSLLCYDENDFEGAAKLMRQAYVICKKALGGDHPDTISMMESLAKIEKRLE
jgi:tetratricopeptide (TPR) repeat protein